MAKQYLLNQDGSVPSSANLELLASEGIPLVIPTAMPRQPGMIAIEKDPQKDDNGIWRQTWVLEAIVEEIAE